MRILWLLLLLMSTGAPGAGLCLRNGHLVDPVARAVTVGDLSVIDGKIAAVGTALKNCPGKVIDLHRQWVIPALHDMHTHASWGNFGLRGARQLLTPIDTAKIMLYAGVTAYLDLFADENLIFPARDAHAPDTARIYAAGPMLTSTGGHGTEFRIPIRTMDTPAGAEKTVRELIEQRHPDVIKIAFDHAREYGSIDRATMAAAVATAKKMGVRSVIHIGNWDDARQAVQAGADVITHLYESEIPDDLVKLMKARGTWEIPTMTYQTEIVHALKSARFLDSRLARAVITPELFASYHPFAIEPWWKQEADWQKKGEQAFPRSLRKLARAGVRLLTGTDSGGAIAVFQGFSVHREMQIFVESGLSPWEALAASTTNATSFLGVPGGLGPGAVAELVVLKASPIVDIRNTEAIALVIANDRVYDDAARNALLQEAGIARKPAGGKAPRPGPFKKSR